MNKYYFVNKNGIAIYEVQSFDKPSASMKMVIFLKISPSDLKKGFNCIDKVIQVV